LLQRVESRGVVSHPITVPQTRWGAVTKGVMVVMGTPTATAKGTQPIGMVMSPAAMPIFSPLAAESMRRASRGRCVNVICHWAIPFEYKRIFRYYWMPPWISPRFLH